MSLKEIRIQFNIPFQVDLPDNPYFVKTEKYSCNVYLVKKIAKDNPSGWYGNPRISEDRFGHTNYSRCLVRFVFTNPINFEENKIQKICTHYALDAVNKILNTCRWKSNEFFNHDILKKDVVGIKYRYFDENNGELGGWSFASTGAIQIGGVSNLKIEEIDSIKDELENNLSFPFVSELVKNSIDYFRFKNYRLACIEIQTATEILLSDLLRTYLTGLDKTEPQTVQNYLEASNRPNPSISDFPKYHWDVIKSVLRKATFDGITRDGICTDWNSKCKETRHKVVHAGHKPEKIETIEALKSGLNFINLIKSYNTTDYNYSNEIFDSAIIDELDKEDEADTSYGDTLSFQELKIDNKQIKKLLEDAKKWMTVGKIKDALKCFDDALALDPINFVVLGNKGIALTKDHQHSDAVKCFDEILFFENEHLLALVQKGNSLVQLKDYSKALQVFEEIIKLKPDHFEALGRKGDVLGILKKYDEALCCYDLALKYKPDLAEAWFKKSLTKYLQGHIKESMTFLTTAIEKNSNYKDKAKNAKIFSEFKNDDRFKKIVE